MEEDSEQLEEEEQVKKGTAQEEDDYLIEDYRRENPKNKDTFPFYIEPKLAKKLDLMIDRLKKRDAWVIVDGDEGSGKTNMATLLLYYVYWRTGRKFSHKNYFYDVQDLRNECQKNENGLYNWDEAALGGLSVQWWNKQQQYLMQFAMTGRIKHHFIVSCIPKFNKLQEYFVKDRSIALINCRHSNKSGYRYIYLTTKGKEKLFDFWKKKGRRAYTKFMHLGGHGGKVPNVFEKVFTPQQQKEYEIRKISMINNIGKVGTKVDKNEEKLKKLRAGIVRLAELYPQISYVKIAEALKIPKTSLYDWKLIAKRENLLDLN